MPLTGKQKHYLRGLAHQRKPVVMVGDAGLTENVIAEIDQALAHHELIKVKIRNSDRVARQQIAESICEQTSCEAVQMIGQIAVFYRKAPSPNINLP
ncbi:MAG: ribosome assembly RNA-binding protein YhbY [Desulfobacterales bacterium]